MRFGDIYFDLTKYTAVFSSIEFRPDLPTAFASPVRENLGVSVWDGSIDCCARSAGHPDIDFRFQGFDDATYTIGMTADDYVRKTPGYPDLDHDCQAPLAMRGDTSDDGEEMPKFVVPGNTFLRKFMSVFDADREGITLIAEWHQ